MALVTIRMTLAEAQQVLSYINARDQGDDSGWYYAPKINFERRHASLKAMFERVITAPLSTPEQK